MMPKATAVKKIIASIFSVIYRESLDSVFEWLQSGAKLAFLASEIYSW